MQDWFNQLLGLEPSQSSTQPAPAPSRRRKITLVLSDMGVPYIPGLGKAVHSSIMIDSLEYEFGPQGIKRSNGPKSHERFAGRPEFIEMGYSMVGGTALMQRLGDDFAPNTYDLLHKNCNTFSDCALYFLVGRRMDDQYRALEKIGQTLNEYTSIVSAFFRGYKPNPRAQCFQTQCVIDSIQGAPSTGYMYSAAQSSKPALLRARTVP
eukprot:TRINITY_DN111794_c0_g1_i1.p1 TRINITY_DN111794_c0_g1~~TRINITY_DN111794_c0_g1_i1.p1  ORF type:complete len:208 (-),score=21.22 TRINITY_DN111794_c0_g1_i1:51-674(-)